MYKSIFITIRKKYKTTLSLFDTATCSYLETMANIFNGNEDLRDVFLSLERKKDFVFLPGPGIVNLPKSIKECTGDLLEHNSLLGPFF